MKVFGATKYRAYERVEGFEMPPSFKEGQSFESLKENLYITEIEGVIPFVKVQVGEDEALIRFLDVPVARMDVERDKDGKLLGFGVPSHKTKDVERTVKALEGQETKDIPVSGFVYGRIVYPEEDVFQRHFGPSSRGILMELFKDDKEFLSNIAYMKLSVNRLMARDDLSEEEKKELIKKQWALLYTYMTKALEENRERIGKHLKTTILVEGEERFFIKSIPDKPVQNIDKSALYVGANRAVMSGTQLAYEISGLFYQLFKENKTVEEALKEKNRVYSTLLKNMIGGVQKPEEVSKLFGLFPRVNASLRRYYKNIKAGMEKEKAEEVLVGELQEFLGEDFKGFKETEREDIKKGLMLLNLQREILENLQEYRSKVSQEEIEEVRTRLERMRRQRQSADTTETSTVSAVETVVETVEQEVYEKVTKEEEKNYISALNRELESDYFGVFAEENIKEGLIRVAKKRFAKV